MADVNIKDATGEVIDDPGNGLVLVTRFAKPADGEVGYAPGCICVVSRGTGYGDSLFYNIGTKASANFDPLGAIGSMTFADLASSSTVARSFLTQESAVPHPVPLLSMRIHDAPSTFLPTTSSSNDLGCVAGTFGTSTQSLRTGDVKGTTESDYARFLFTVPAHYVAGQAITLRVNCGMVTTVSDTTATIDVECYRVAAPTVDICATAAVTMNSLTAANKDFTITPTNVVVGDTLDVRLTTAVVDGATATAVIAAIYSVSFLLSVKG